MSQYYKNYGFKDGEEVRVKGDFYFRYRPTHEYIAHEYEYHIVIRAIWGEPDKYRAERFYSIGKGSLICGDSAIRRLSKEELEKLKEERIKSYDAHDRESASNGNTQEKQDTLDTNEASETDGIDKTIEKGEKSDIPDEGKVNGEIDSDVVKKSEKWGGAARLRYPDSTRRKGMRYYCS